MNYEDLTKRIEKARGALVETKSQSSTIKWWEGYIAALSDVRNSCNTGGKHEST